MTKPSFAGRTLVGTFTRLNRRRPWHRLPLPGALLNLIALRIELRQHNLTDTRTPDPSARRGPVTLDQCPHLAGRFRTPDGSYNALDDPDMGMTGTRFGRNVALDKAFPESMPGLMEPNPHTISRTLMRRTDFTPATSLNLLAAAWIQFQTHDWFAHDRETDDLLEIDLPDGHSWHENPMRIPRTPRRRHAHRARRAPAADLHQPGLALVGLLGHLRQLAGAARPGPHVQRRQARREGRPAAARRPDGYGDHRASARTGGSAWGCCTPSSPSSTTPSATR